MFGAITEPGTIQFGILRPGMHRCCARTLLATADALANQLLGDEEFGEAEFVVEGGECALH